MTANCVVMAAGATVAIGESTGEAATGDSMMAGVMGEFGGGW